MQKAILILLGLLSLSMALGVSSHRRHRGAANMHAANGYKYFVGDFNGDRWDDFVRQKVGSWASGAEIYLSGGRGVFTKKDMAGNLDLNGELTNLYVGDFNGDGQDDILRQEKGSWTSDRVNTAYLILSKDDQGNFERIVLNEDFDLNGELTNLYIGDFNGDGKDDILRQEKGSWTSDRVNTAYLLLSTGKDFRKIVLSEDYDLNGELTNLFVGDFNSDGLDDILRQEKGHWSQEDRVNTAYLLLSTGDSFKKIVLNEDYDLNGELTTLTIGDFNGDGRSDVLRREKGGWASDNVNSAYLLLSNGRENANAFDKTVLNEDFAIKASNTNVYVGDFNGDRKDDFIRQEKGDISKDNIRTTEIFLSTGNNFRVVAFPDDTEMKGDISTLYVGDFNADKVDDFIQYWGTDTQWVHYSQHDGTFM